MKILKCALIAIRNYDNFGVSFDFNIKGKKQYKSICGGILSLLMTFIMLVIFSSGVISIIKREKFQINVQQKQNINPEYQEMNISNFMLAIKLDDPFKEYYPNDNKTSYSIVVNQVLITTTENGQRNKSVISQQFLENCRAEHFLNVEYEGQEQIKKDLNGYLCLPLNYSLKLQGNFNSKVFYYPALKISVCKTDNCYTTEQLENFAKNESFMVTLSTLIQSSIFIKDSQDNNIIQTFNSDFFLQTNLLQERKADLFFKNNQIQVNNNLFSLQQDVQEKNYWSFSIFNSREYQEYHTSPSTIFSVNFRISQESEQTKKQVNTFDDFLSYFGGLLKVISSIFGLIALKYNALGLKISVANHLYQFNIPKKVNGEYQFSYDNLLCFIETQIHRVSDLQNKLKNHAKSILQQTRYMKAWVNQKFSMTNINQQQSHQQQQQQNQSQLQTQSGHNQQIEQIQVEKYIEQLQAWKLNFLQDLISKINQTRKELRLGINFIFYELLCCSCCESVKQTRRMLQVCEKVINQDLDIIHLLKKIQEIDKLKQILLVEDQIKVFDYTPKPVINVVTKKKFDSDTLQNSLIQRETQEQKKQANLRKKGFTTPKSLLVIYKSYFKLKEDPSQLNGRIIELLGPTIELIFQNYYSLQQMATKYINMEGDKEEKIVEEHISAPRSNQYKSTIRMTSHQFIQISPKTLKTDDDEINEE